MRFLILVPAVLVLAGCGPSREQLVNQATNDCLNYGTSYGTPQYTQCMMMKDQQINDNQIRRQAAVQEALSGMQRSIDASRPIQMAPRTCNSSVIGNQVQTNCY
jgi:hypothetical protein